VLFFSIHSYKREKMTEEVERTVELSELTAGIVSAYIANNPLPVASLGGLIIAVHRSLSGLGEPLEPPAKKVIPAVSPKKSVFPDYIVCLDDGKKFKSLKRHLRGLGMTADQYREKWKLPRDYPMVAPNSAAKRSALSKRGRNATAADVAPSKVKRTART
jgi:predicted transcriptional regulator